MPDSNLNKIALRIASHVDRLVKSISTQTQRSEKRYKKAQDELEAMRLRLSSPDTQMTRIELIKAMDTDAKLEFLKRKYIHSLRNICIDLDNKIPVDSNSLQECQQIVYMIQAPLIVLLRKSWRTRSESSDGKIDKKITDYYIQLIYDTRNTS